MVVRSAGAGGAIQEPPPRSRVTPRIPRGRTAAMAALSGGRYNRGMAVENSKGVRVAAVGDLHCSRESRGSLESLFSRMAAAADAILLCGDLTDYGLPEEARILVDELKGAERAPIVAVLGNHDYESGRQAEVIDILRAAGIHVLDGEAWEHDGVGYAGVKGFAGGFGERALQPWGEPSLKRVVRESHEEAMKLEKALARLRSPTRVALMHYSPIIKTVEGEPREILPFLGSSHLEEPLNRYSVAFAVHGHAHHGAVEGRTAAGVPVYNVALPLLKRKRPAQPPFLVLDVPRPQALHGASRK